MTNLYNSSAKGLRAKIEAATSAVFVSGVHLFVHPVQGLSEALQSLSERNMCNSARQSIGGWGGCASSALNIVRIFAFVIVQAIPFPTLHRFASPFTTIQFSPSSPENKPDPSKLHPKSQDENNEPKPVQLSQQEQSSQIEKLTQQVRNLETKDNQQRSQIFQLQQQIEKQTFLTCQPVFNPEQNSKDLDKITQDKEFLKKENSKLQQSLSTVQNQNEDLQKIKSAVELINKAIQSQKVQSLQSKQLHPLLDSIYQTLQNTAKDLKKAQEEIVSNRAAIKLQQEQAQLVEKDLGDIVGLIMAVDDKELLQKQKPGKNFLKFQQGLIQYIERLEKAEKGKAVSDTLCKNAMDQRTALLNDLRKISQMKEVADLHVGNFKDPDMQALVKNIQALANRATSNP